jgi:hypothetical protein
MANSDDTTPDITIRELQRRLEALEQALVELGNQVTTRRIAVLDGDVERLVAETVEGVFELRLELPRTRRSSSASRRNDRTAGRNRSAVLVFTAAGESDLAAGLGVQLWARGNLVSELTWWEDEDQQRYGMGGPLEPDASPGPTAPPPRPEARAPEPPPAAPT